MPERDSFRRVAEGAAMVVEHCGSCGEEPLVCNGCGDAFCPCGIKNDPEGIWELCRDLDRCRDCVVEPTLEMAGAWALIPRRIREGALRDLVAVRERRREVRKVRKQ